MQYVTDIVRSKTNEKPLKKQSFKGLKVDVLVSE